MSRTIRYNRGPDDSGPRIIHDLPDLDRYLSISIRRVPVKATPDPSRDDAAIR